MVQRISTDNYLRCGILVWQSSRNKISEKSIMSVMTFAALVHHDSPTITMNPILCRLLDKLELDTSNNIMLNVYNFIHGIQDWVIAHHIVRHYGSL